MKLKKVLIPLALTICCSFYFAAFAIICAARSVSGMALTLGILIPANVVLVSVILFVRGYFEIRREAEESEKEKEKQK